MNIQHRIDRPHESGCIEVYGDDPYEWRILDHTGHVVRDSAGYGSGTGAYASPELALRDAISFDADDSVVPIFFRHGGDAELENAAQAHRTADILRAMVLAMNSAIGQAQSDSRHATDGEAQDYLDARIIVLQRLVREIDETAGRLQAAIQATAE